VNEQSIICFQNRASVPPDSRPDLSRLSWSPCGRLLVYAASNGRVFVYDESGAAVYSIVSQNLPAWNAPTDTRSSYAGVFFTTARAGCGRDWIAEMVLVDYSGKICSFLLSYSGYQVRNCSKCTISLRMNKFLKLVFESRSGLFVSLCL
jgi:hypothetical protein